MSTTTITLSNQRLLSSWTHHHINKTTDHNIILRSDIAIINSQFLEYQKELLDEVILNLYEEIVSLDSWDIDDIKKTIEFWLQQINSSLSTFASKVRSNAYFNYQWVIQVIVGHDIITSLIGTTSLIIIRDNTIFYKIDNKMPSKWSCDLFADLIEWELESHDQILIFGTHLSQTIDREDIKELNKLITQWQQPYQLVEDVLLTRISEEWLWIWLWFTYEWVSHRPLTSTLWSWFQNNISQRLWRYTSKDILQKNSFVILVSVLWVIVLLLLYNVLSSAFLSNTNQNTITTSSGVVIISMEDIKKDIALFQRIDPTDDKKKDQYNTIMQRLELLEKNNKRPDDVKKLKDILNAEYNIWFNITPLSTILWSTMAIRILQFTPQDIQLLGTPLAISFDRTISIAWSSASLIGAVSDDIKWTPITHPKIVNWCSTNPQKNWFYCYINQWNSTEIFNITKAGTASVISKWAGFVWWIIDLQMRWRWNMFAIHNNIWLNRANNMIIKYSTTPGKLHEYQEWQSYTATNPQQTWQLFGSGFSSLGIDGNFLVRDKANKKVIQLRRDRIRTNPTLMTSRTIQLIWWDTSRLPFSDDVKILTYQNTEDVYLFDRKNQSLTVYKSNPTKKNDTFRTTYNLNYQFRIAFDQTENPVIDVVINQPWGKTEAYLLTQRGVIRLSLSELSITN